MDAGAHQHARPHLYADRDSHAHVYLHANIDAYTRSQPHADCHQYARAYQNLYARAQSHSPALTTVRTATALVTALTVLVMITR